MFIKSSYTLLIELLPLALLSSYTLMLVVWGYGGFGSFLCPMVSEAAFAPKKKNKEPKR